MAAEKRPATVKIKCTSARLPWTDERPLQKDEVVDVYKEVADALIKAGFAELCK